MSPARRASLELALHRQWMRRDWITVLLLPLTAVYVAAVTLRRSAWRRGWLRTGRLPVPVIVVGNLTVGGTGKTPLVIWIVRELAAAGYRPGVVARGYHGGAHDWPRMVTPSSPPGEVGDEPVLIARQTSCPVAAGPDRVAAARRLIQEADCNVLVSDDGLQHYRLGRNLEIAVIDGERRFGNRLCLPAGPLREPLARLGDVDLRVCNGHPQPGELAMELVAEPLRRVDGGGEPVPAGEFSPRRVHAIAGIGNPRRFFSLLAGLGFDTIPHVFPDHARYRPEDLQFGDRLPVIMTAKDALKCVDFAGRDVWFLPVSARPDPSLREALFALLRKPS